MPAERVGASGVADVLPALPEQQLHLPVQQSDLPERIRIRSFTTDLMMLSWTHWDCLICCSGEVTDTNTLTLTKSS